MNMSQVRARVFISCGQAVDSGELATAREVAESLERLGYDPYVALQEQTLKGVKENVFAQLRDSEYFVFIDFKREALTGFSGEHRGSLFSHQELAIASFLDIPVLAVQEEGVRREDGLLRFLQGNSITFSSRGGLSRLIEREVEARGWTSGWRNILVLERPLGQWEDANRPADDIQSAEPNLTMMFPPNVPFDPRGSAKRGRMRTARYFAVTVRNHHPRDPARNCLLYLERAVNLMTGRELELRTAELKWSGYTSPNANIGPGSWRNFPGLWVWHSDSEVGHFDAFTDSPRYLPRLQGPGRFELTFAVHSDNFRTAHRSFISDLHPDLDKVSLSPAIPTDWAGS